MSDLNKLILSYLGHEPTTGQKMAAEVLDEFVHTDDEALMLLTGYAGTGKTTLIASLVKSLSAFRFQTCLMAPTGRAAKVLAGYSGKPAFTIHKTIYRQKKATEGIGEFVVGRNLRRNTIFIVDEASMIADRPMDLSPFGSGRLLEDLISYVYSSPGCKLMLVGDEAQLPPVGFNQSPALDEKYLNNFGKRVFYSSLREVVRQSLESGILVNATSIREQIIKQQLGYPGLDVTSFKDVQLITGDNLLESLQSSYDRVGLEETLVVSRSNRQANRYNGGIRSHILWREDEIGPGDLVMVVKNNYFWLQDSEEVDFIANGDVLEVVRVKGTKELYQMRFAEMVLRFTDYRQFEFEALVILNTLTAESASLDRETMRNFYAEVAVDYQYMKGKKHRNDAIRNDRYFNALQIKFAYGLTCHKAQGGQWKHVYVDQGYLDESKLDVEYYRWLYTAITRATEQLYLVNFRQEFLRE